MLSNKQLLYNNSLLLFIPIFYEQQACELASECRPDLFYCPSRHSASPVLIKQMFATIGRVGELY